SGQCKAETARNRATKCVRRAAPPEWTERRQRIQFVTLHAATPEHGTKRSRNSATERNAASRGAAFWRPPGARFRQGAFPRKFCGRLGDAVSADGWGKTDRTGK